MLLDNAREKGAEVREETIVNHLLMDGEQVVGVEATDRKSGRIYEVRAPITLDCTGKEAFTANKRGWRMRDPYLNKIAVWTYYKGSKREPDIDEGATTVAYVPEKGWFWHIPQTTTWSASAGRRQYWRAAASRSRARFSIEVEETNDQHSPRANHRQITQQDYSHSRYCAAGLTARRRCLCALDPVSAAADVCGQERPNCRRSRPRGFQRHPLA
jgi:flavin-dependent dehydrogenase